METITAGAPIDKAKGVVIWLHGLGANGQDFHPIVPQLGLPDTLPLHFIFPTAPELPVTINGGMLMPAWYDITAMAIEQQIDWAGIENSVGMMNDLISWCASNGHQLGDIVLAGFSQGAVVAAHTALHNPAVRGLMMLSGYLPTKAPIAKALQGEVMVAHGTEDEIVPHALAIDTREKLTAAGTKLRFFDYPMGHEVCLPEVKEIGRYLSDIW